MNNKLMSRVAAFALAGALVLGGVGAAYAASFGNRLNGASSVEVFQVRYDGAAWNYSGSGYNGAWFRYSRNGRALLYKYVTKGITRGSVWDNLVDWSGEQTTRFNWGRA